MHKRPSQGWSYQEEDSKKIHNNRVQGLIKLCHINSILKKALGDLFILTSERLNSKERSNAKDRVV